jgi:Beta/Gamma crystallin
MSECTHKIVLFSEINFTGKALVVFGEIDNFYLKLYDWNDRAKSLIVVKGNWTLQGDLNGEEKTATVVEGSEYKNLSLDLPEMMRSISIVTHL